mmetsp:Transcript_146194/g.255049  ORF Transcript_146194/g.255049 Transcript_146194/m.255049 type:complete len:84 (+) Transcript_146194:306-557(+)
MSSESMRWRRDGGKTTAKKTNMNVGDLLHRRSPPHRVITLLQNLLNRIKHGEYLITRTAARTHANLFASEACLQGMKLNEEKE